MKFYRSIIPGNPAKISSEKIFHHIYFFCHNFSIQAVITRRTTRGRGEASPALFWKFKKSALILERKTLIVSIRMLNVLFKK